MKWKALYPHVRDIEPAGKHAEVWIDNKKKSTSNVDKEIQRQLRANPDLSTALPLDLPKGVIVRECSSTAMIQGITTDLPFHSFESYMYSNLPIMTRNDYLDASLRVSKARSTDTGIWNPESGIEKELQVVVPNDQGVDESSDFSVMAPDTRLFASPLHRSILFSVVNNFAGLGVFP